MNVQKYITWIQTTILDLARAESVKESPKTESSRSSAKKASTKSSG